MEGIELEDGRGAWKVLKVGLQGCLNWIFFLISYAYHTNINYFVKILILIVVIKNELSNHKLMPIDYFNYSSIAILAAILNHIY